MDTNCYALEVLAKARLAELRAAARRSHMLASSRAPGRSLWGALGSLLRLTRHSTAPRDLARPRHA